MVVQHQTKCNIYPQQGQTPTNNRRVVVSGHAQGLALLESIVRFFYYSPVSGVG